MPEPPETINLHQEGTGYFRDLCENSLAGEYVLQDGHMIYVNPAFARVFGYKPLELTGRDLLIVVHPDDRPRVVEMMKNPPAGTAKALHIECRGLHKDGRIVDIQLLGGIWITLGGQPARIGSMLEITERKQAEKQLQKLSRAVEQSPATVLITDADGNIEYANPKFSHVTGYTVAEVIGRNPRILKSGLTPLPTYQELWETILSGREWHGEIINKKKNGELYWESASISPIKDGAGIITHFIAVKEDITERKKAEEGLKKAEEEYRRLFAEAVEGIFRTSPEGSFIAANPAVARILGYTSAEEFISSIPDAGRQVWEAPGEWQSIVKLLEQQGTLRGYECQFNRKDGTVIWVSLNAHRSLGPDGRTQYYQGSIEDITERRQAREALEVAHEKLERSMRVLESRSGEITTLSEFGRLLQSCLNNEEAYRVVKAYCQKLFPSFSGSVYLTSASRDLVQSVVSWGDFGVSEPTFEPVDCWALRSGHMQCVEDQGAPVQCDHMPSNTEISYLCVPLMAQGEAMGVFHIECPSHAQAAVASPEDWTAFKISRQELANAVAEHVALALANLQLRETLRSQSIRDPLTGLFNRRFMEESLEREILRAGRNNSTIGILLLDIDHFKRYNDTFGHEAGDAVLREVGALLRKQVRGEDIPCRYGGEEFLLLLPGAPAEIALHRAEQLREAVRHLNVNFHGQTLGTLTISIGVAMFPQHGTGADSLLESGDRALYTAKESGRDQVLLATPISSPS